MLLSIKSERNCILHPVFMDFVSDKDSDFEIFQNFLS
jgi:hypothetical protein